MSSNNPQNEEYVPKDYDANNVPQDPYQDVPWDNEENAPQQYEDQEDARQSIGKSEADAETNGPKSRLGEGVGNLKGAAIDAAKNKVAETVPGGQAAQETIDKAARATSFVKNVGGDIKNIAVAVKGGVVAIFNPYSLIALAVILVVTVLIISITAVAQVYGQTKSTSTAGSAAGAMQQRLAQRADWLQKHYQEYGPTTGPLWEMAPSPKSSLGANEWRAACPNIVAFIYGLSPYLINWNGNVNARDNWAAHPEMYESYAFNDGRSSAGANLSNPPAGAIVSINYPGGKYGHTFVMLTDELVIDNWSGGGIVFGTIGGGPRIISDTMRGQIVGWALPKSEGFEGTFITGSFEGAAEGAPDQAPMPDLPPVPTWAGGGEGVPGGTSGGGTYNGPAERAGWMRSAGIAESDWTYVDYIAQKESSWNPNATNASSGACGLIQALPCSKVPGNGYDPVDNLRWADGYAKSRYGSWAAAHEFWVANHWW